MQNYPYSDKDMVYDYNKHRYILTADTKLSNNQRRCRRIERRKHNLEICLCKI